MFGYLKKFLARMAPKVTHDQQKPLAAGIKASTPEAHNGQSRNLANHPRQTGSNGHRMPISSGLRLPLQVVVMGLPQELQARLRHKEISNQTIGIALEAILPQLPRGSVKIPFGQVRQAAPDFFSAQDDHDQVLVALPLGEILSRLNPAFIHRRAQKQVEVPDDICSPFDSPGRAKSPNPEMPPAQAAHALLDAPPLKLAPRNGHSGPSAPFTPARNITISMPAPVPPTATGNTPPCRAEPDAQPQRASFALPKPAPANDPNALFVSLIAMVDNWPEAVRNEIVQLKLDEAKLALPGEITERALKQGRLAFSWKTVKSWIQPTPPPTVSAHDHTLLELPLRIVAPLFLARQRSDTPSRQKAAVDETIPNLFFGTAHPASTEKSPSPRTGDAGFFASDDRAHRSATPAKGSPGPQPLPKCASPNEVVTRAAALDHVAGALIALSDGLMVASRLNSEVNGDTLAAFLPQIFGKVSQSTRELRMGELHNLSFTIGSVTWKIFRVNGIFFAVFAEPGQGLPVVPLAALAEELDHKH